MSEEMTRKEVIWQLKGLLLGELRTTTKERKALEYAISSLETDEAYKLMYEQPEFCEDCIDRKFFIRDLYCKAHGETSINIHWLEGYIKELPSVLPKADVPENNVGKIELTTKNDLGVDCIDRAQAQTEIEMNASRYSIAKERGGMGQVEWSDQLIKVSDAVDIIRNLPSVAPQEPRKGHCKDCKWWKDSDGLYRRGGHAESQCPINRREVFEGNGYCYMFEPQESEV